MAQHGSSFLLIVATVLWTVACTVERPAPGRELVAGEGFVDVTGGKVWYRIVGSGRATPLLLLHGGPGATSYYLRPLERLSDERPVIFYDQLGCGRSERPNDPSLWTVERFVSELGQIRETLGLERVHIYGHSWGTMLAVEYLLTKPTGVESLILASPAISIPRWLEDTNALRAALPPETREVLDRHEKAGTTDSDEYAAATREFYNRHLCRLVPWPRDMEDSMTHMGWGVYHAMWGPSEFFATGTLKAFDRTDRLGEIRLPTLFTAGAYDEATPEATEWYRSLVPGASLEVLPNSSHMAMLEEPDRYLGVLREFLRKVEAGGAQ